MATIKLQNGKVLTRVRDGRTLIQCECCADEPPAECCPYPVDKLDVLYRREDLPETLTIRQSALGGTISMTLTQSGQNIYEGTSGGTLYRLVRSAIGVFGTWELEGFSPIPQQWFGVQDWSGQICLFWDYSGAEQSTWPLSPPDPQGGGGFSYPDDDFQDTYIATSPDGPTLTMVREGLCIWRSRNANGDVDNTLYYDTNANEQNLANNGGVLGRILWRFNGVYRTDAGPYNSPEGVYGNTWTVV